MQPQRRRKTPMLVRPEDERKPFVPGTPTPWQIVPAAGLALCAVLLIIGFVAGRADPTHPIVTAPPTSAPTRAPATRAPTAQPTATAEPSPLAPSPTTEVMQPVDNNAQNNAPPASIPQQNAPEESRPPAEPLPMLADPPTATPAPEPSCGEHGRCDPTPTDCPAEHGRCDGSGTLPLWWGLPTQAPEVAQK